MNLPKLFDADAICDEGLRVHRPRLGLSADKYGRLVGVNAQTIYSWERRKSTPHAKQRASLAAVRGLGKREARARLEPITARGGKRGRKPCPDDGIGLPKLAS